MRDTFDTVKDILNACDNRHLTAIAEMTVINHVNVKTMLSGFLRKGWVTRDRRGGRDYYTITINGEADLARLEELVTGLPGHKPLNNFPPVADAQLCD